MGRSKNFLTNLEGIKTTVGWAQWTFYKSPKYEDVKAGGKQDMLVVKIEYDESLRSLRTNI